LISLGGHYVGFSGSRGAFMKRLSDKEKIIGRATLIAILTIITIIVIGRIVVVSKAKREAERASGRMWALSLIQTRYRPSPELLKIADSASAPCLWTVRDSSSCNGEANQQCWIVTCQARIKEKANARDLHVEWLVDGHSQSETPVGSDTTLFFNKCPENRSCLLDQK
jgi:hypothetical protein